MEKISQRPSLSVMIPAYNEEENIEPSIRKVLDAFKKLNFENYEIIVFDDGSTDRTGEIAEKVALEDSNIRVVHNEKNMNLGYNYRKAIELVSCEYLGWAPGDNETPSESLEIVFESVGKTASVIPYTLNQEIRPMARRIISKVYTASLNFLFGLNLKYFNGLNVHPVRALRKLDLRTNSFACNAEAVICLLKSNPNHSYIQPGYPIKPRLGEVKAFRIKNVISTMTAILSLFWRIQIKRHCFKY